MVPLVSELSALSMCRGKFASKRFVVTSVGHYVQVSFNHVLLVAILPRSYAVAKHALYLGRRSPHGHERR